MVAGEWCAATTAVSLTSDPSVLKAFVCIAAGLSLAPAALAQENHDASSERRNPLARSKAAIQAGAKRFSEGCALCHGGKAEGGRGPALANNRDLFRIDDGELFDIIEHGIAGTNMPPSNLPEQTVWEIAAYIRSLSSPASETPVEGDAKAGRELFYGAGRCNSCHAIHGEGGVVGPDLTNAGWLTVLQLRDSLSNPNRDITAGFEHVTAVLSDGDKIDGVAKANSDYAIQILDAQSHLHNLNKSTVHSIVFYRDSLMPSNFAVTLGTDGIDNIVAFLAQQVVRPPGEQPAGRRHRHMQ
jgi:putative heme-binding domain-containing protein